jgi:phage-related protein
LDNTTVGEIGLNLVLNRQGFSKSLNAVQEQANSVSNNMKSSLKKLGSAIVAAFSVAAIKQFGQQCIESAAQVNAANSQFEQTFGSMESQAKSAIQSVAKESGILETRLQGVGTSIYAFAKTTGMDSANALNMMQEALQVTADSAAYYDRSLEDTAESLKSFLKGNFENDAALGLSCTETTRNAAANKLYGKSFTELSESQKQLTLLEMVKDANKLSGAIGQASRESDGWENVTGNLKESWNQLLAVIGKPILQVATNIVQKLSSAIAKLTEYAKGAINALSKLFNWDGDDTANSISAAASSAENLTDEAESGSNSLESVADSAEKAKNSVAGFDKLNVLTKSDSGGSDASASDTASSSGTSVANAVVKDTNSGVSGAFKNLYEKSGFKGFVDNVQKGINKVDWSAIGKNCESIFKNSVPIAQNYLTQVQKVGKSAFGAVGSFVGGVVQVSGKRLQTLTGGVAKWLDKDKNKINGFITTIGDNFSKGYDNLSTFFEKGFDVIGQSVDRVRPQMEDAISNLLSGFTDFGGAVGTIFSEGFSLATESLVKWIDNDGATIGEFFDNIQLQMADVMNFVGGVFSDIGNFLLGWWDGEGGSEIFQNVCDMFLNIGTTLMNVYNDWIMPAWNFIVGVFQSAWTDCLKPIFEQLWTVFGKACDYIATIWNNWLLPFVNFISDTLGPVFNTVLRNIQSIFETVFRVIGDVVGGILKSFGGLIDFITGIFSGNWEKAWNGIKDFFGGIWDGIWGIIKGFVNLIIDGINLLLTGIYTVVAAIVNAIGGIADTIGSIFGQEWGWSMPNEPVLIPHLATGGLVKAPTLAVVGDNAGANSGNPEVIAPLSKLQGMINTSNGEDTVILGEILSYLKKLYEMFVIFRNNGGNYYQFVAEINGNDIFNEIVKQNELYKNRHNGKSAFA